MTSGIVGTGFSRSGKYLESKGNFQISKKQEGLQVILDYYVLSRNTSNFVYIPLGNKKVEGYALSNEFIWRKLFVNDKYYNYLRVLQAETKSHYKLHIYDKVNLDKLDYLKKL